MPIHEDQFYIEECLADLTRIERVVNSLAFMFIYPKDGEEDTVNFFIFVQGNRFKFLPSYFIFKIRERGFKSH